LLVANDDFRHHQLPLALACGGGLGILQRATAKDQKAVAILHAIFIMEMEDIYILT
jgi:hypothetical protein